MSENPQDIRWKQRFQNFQNAFMQLDQAVSNVDKLSVLEKEGMVQRFEYTFELAWKTLKDFLEDQNVEAKFPREVIKKAFEYQVAGKCFSFGEAISTCPTNWGLTPLDALKWAEDTLLPYYELGDYKIPE